MKKQPVGAGPAARGPVRRPARGRGDPDRGHHPGRRRTGRAWAARPPWRPAGPGGPRSSRPTSAPPRSGPGSTRSTTCGGCTPASTWSPSPGPGPVVAVAAGTVTAAAYRGGYGNAVDVDHGGGITSRYAHLARITPTIRPGTTVTAGQVLGVEGSTGTSTGNHLHLEILRNGDPGRPGAVHGRPRRTPGRTRRRTHPHHRRPGRSGGRDRVRPPARRHPPPDLPDHPARHHPRRTSRPCTSPPPTRYQLPWTLLAGIGMEETAHGRTTATSSAGAQGLMQFMPATFAAYGVDGDGDGRRQHHAATPTACSRRRTTSPGPASPRAPTGSAKPCTRTTTPPGTSTTSCTTPTPTAAGSSWATRPAALAEQGNPNLDPAARRPGRRTCWRGPGSRPASRTCSAPTAPTRGTARPSPRPPTATSA